VTETIYLRKGRVAQRYDTSVRTVERWIKTGLLPPPDLYRGVHPLWSSEKLDASDREAAARGRGVKQPEIAA